jgi:outer membrane cobalamin receptor
MRRVFITTCLTLLLVANMNLRANPIADSLIIDEVVVTGTRTSADARYLPLTVSSIGRQQIDQSFCSSLLPLVNEQVPGVFVTQRGILGFGVSSGAAGGIKVRGIGGSPTTEMMVLVDGSPHYAGLMGHTIADLYQSLVAEKVEVVRGPASVLYGSNAMGGVMNIITRQALVDGLTNKIRLQGGSYGTMDGEYAGTQRFGAFSNMIGLSASSSDGHRTNMHFEQYSLVDNMSLRLNDKWTARGEIDMTHFISNNPGMVSAPLIDNYMNIHRGIASFGFNNKYERASGSATYYIDWGHHKIDDGHTAQQAEQKSLYMQRDHTYGVNLFETFNFFQGNNTTFGFDYQHVDGSAWTKAKDDGATSYYVKDKNADELAGYVDFRQTLFNVFTLDAALRYNHHSHAGNEWIPQLGISITPMDNSVLKATVSKGFRNPTLRELYMFKPANEELKAERMMNYELSWHQDLGKFNYSANIFYIDADNLIQTERIDGKPLNVNTGTLYNWGVELASTYMACRNLYLNANYSYLHTSKAITAAPRHKLYVGGDYRMNRLTLSTGVQWIGHLLTSTSDEAEAQNYVLWNLSASYKATTWASFFVKGENLLAQEYETYQGFPMPHATVMAGVDVEF